MTAAPAKFEFIESGPIDGGRIEIYAEPNRERFYCIGIDFAFGLDSGDFDAAVMLDDHGEQVAEVHGHWGERFGDVLLPLLDWFDPFIVGEPTATGLPILRSFYDAGRWIYHHRAESTKGRKVRDQLGHVPGPSDVTIHWLRRDLAERDRKERTARHRLVIRSETLHGELCKFRFFPRRETQSIDEARDRDLKWGAPKGEHDDLVRALAMANAGLEWLPRFERPKPKLPETSIGHIIGIDDEDEETKSKWD